MSKLLSAAELAEEALRHVGVYSVNDSGADPNELSVALLKLDLLTAQFAGSERVWWLVPASATQSMITDKASYTLIDDITDITDRIEHLIKVNILDSNDEVVSELEQITRETYDNIIDKDTAGLPAKIYIDRTQPKQIAYIYPVPDGSVTYKLYLHWQNYPVDMTKLQGARSHEWPMAWQRWAILQTAYDCSIGPIRWLPKEERDTLGSEAESARRKLEAFFNPQKTYRRTKARPF